MNQCVENNDLSIIDSFNRKILPRFIPHLIKL